MNIHRRIHVKPRILVKKRRKRESYYRIFRNFANDCRLSATPDHKNSKNKINLKPMYQSYPCDYSLPAEWSPQSGIMLTWPHGGTDWKPYLRQITDTYLELSEIITRYEQLLIATPIVESTRRMLASPRVNAPDALTARSPLKLSSSPTHSSVFAPKQAAPLR
jgi:hypothetical protein